jgi:hypothetical protein
MVQIFMVEARRVFPFTLLDTQKLGEVPDKLQRLTKSYQALKMLHRILNNTQVFQEGTHIEISTHY